MRVVKVDGNYATVDYNGVQTVADASLVDVAPGDYVIVHAGMIIAKLNEEEALETLRLWDEIAKLQDLF